MEWPGVPESAHRIRKVSTTIQEQVGNAIIYVLSSLMARDQGDGPREMTSERPLQPWLPDRAIGFYCRGVPERREEGYTVDLFTGCGRVPRRGGV